MVSTDAFVQMTIFFDTFVHDSKIARLEQAKIVLKGPHFKIEPKVNSVFFRTSLEYKELNGVFLGLVNILSDIHDSSKQLSGVGVLTGKVPSFSHQTGSQW